MKICITGSNGFIGKYIIQDCLDKNIDIIPTVKNPKNIVEKDKSLTKILDIHKINDNIYSELGFPDSIIHLAWAGLPNYLSNHHLEIELPAQYFFLKKLIKSGLKNLTIAGTCFEYGMASGCLDEKMKSNPVNPYGIAKYKLFQKLCNLKSKYKFNLKWCRIFYLYGIGQNEKSLWSQLVSDVSMKKNILKCQEANKLEIFCM